MVKALLPIDAQVGAYMEAVEFYFAEPSSGKVITRCGTPREVAGGEEQTNAILDFNPILNRKINLDDPLLLAVGQDIDSGKECLLPAELVYHPAPDVGQRLFGSSTNGLASGNAVLEASLHALVHFREAVHWLRRDTADYSRGRSPIDWRPEKNLVQSPHAHPVQRFTAKTLPHAYRCRGQRTAREFSPLSYQVARL